MDDQQNQRFVFLDQQDPQEADHNNQPSKNKFAKPETQFNINGIVGGLGWKPHHIQSQQNYTPQTDDITEQERQKDRKIRKLTNINKHLLQQLKDQNDELTKKVEKQKFITPKKSITSSRPKNKQKQKQLQSAKRQLQNAYRQIEFYKENISKLKANQIPENQHEKIADLIEKARQKDEDIEKIQKQIKIQKSIKSHQEKILQKLNNKQMTQLINNLNQEIKKAKARLKEVKIIVSKRQQLQKKQRIYLIELQTFIKNKKNQIEEGHQNQIKSAPKQNESEISQLQWKDIKEKLLEQKSKYQEFGRKLTYHNYIKSKHTKALEEMQLKIKQKAKILEKLNSKLTEVNKLARLKPRPEILEKPGLRMEKLKDIISRQSTIQMSKPSKINPRIQSEDSRQFKKWQLQHASRQNDLEERISNIKGEIEYFDGVGRQDKFVALPSKQEQRTY